MTNLTQLSDHADQRRRELAEMQAGPRLDGDRIVVPSYQHNAQAATFWKLHGFLWFPATQTWERDTNLCYNNKNYKADCWLISTRREFFKFWPTLAQATIQTITTRDTQTPLDEHPTRGNWR